jgi:ATP synthase protein I
MPDEQPERTPEERARATAGQGDVHARKNEADAWGAFGLVVSGVAVWGGVGWFVSERTGNDLPLLVGLLVGMSAGLYLVWFRYGRA